MVEGRKTRMDVTTTEDSIGLIGKREYCGTLNISPEIRKGEKHQTLRFSSCHVKYVLRYEECEQVSSVQLPMLMKDIIILIYPKNLGPFACQLGSKWHFHSPFQSKYALAKNCFW